jgi:hypothetical protein
MEPFLGSIPLVTPSIMWQHCGGEVMEEIRMPRRKSTDVIQLKLRFREELRHLIEKSARERDISLNGEIVRRLEESIEDDKLPPRRDLATALLRAVLNHPDTTLLGDAPILTAIGELLGDTKFNEAIRALLDEKKDSPLIKKKPALYGARFSSEGRRPRANLKP